MRAHSIEDGEHLITCWCHYEQKPAASDHAAVKEEHRKWAEQFFKAVSAETLIQGQVENLLAQWHADAVRDARVKEAETWMEELTRPVHGRHTWDWAKDRIEQLKRGEA